MFLFFCSQITEVHFIIQCGNGLFNILTSKAERKKKLHHLWSQRFNRSLLHNFLGSGPKGPMSCRTQGCTVTPIITNAPPRALSPNLCIEAKIPACWPKAQPVFPNPSLLAQIPASRPKFQPVSPNSSLLVWILPLRP